MWTHRTLRLGVAVAAICLVLGPGPLAQTPVQSPATPALPASLTPAQFWKLSADLSEPDGYFRSENLVSNEHTYQYVIPALKKAVAPGGAYLGVAPDQNFTFMAAIRPSIAFILDIRRGNLLEHLMYKALFELSTDRADFVSRLFSKPRPAGLTATTSVYDLFSAYARVATSETLYRKNLAAMRTHLTRTRGFPLTADDWQQLETIYFAFFWDGPSLRYTSNPNGMPSGRGASIINTRFPSYEELIIQTDWEGTPRSYLANEDNFRFIKSLQQKNLIIPVIGNFAGTKSLRSIGRYLRERRTPVTAYYVSNVEQYLYQDQLFDAFARNVATLPVDRRSTFIRSVSTRFGYDGTLTWSDGRATALYPIAQFVRDHEVGLLSTYFDLNARSAK